MKTTITKYLLLTCIVLSSCSEPLDVKDDNGNPVDDECECSLTPPQAFINPKNDDEYFFNYRLENFAPDTEPFIKETFGSQLTIEQTGFWEHNSYNSHAVGFSTALPAISIIEYGETDQYGQTTEQSDSYYYQHLHHIKGLESGKTYHYRIKAQDYDGICIISGDYTFTTKEFTPDIIRIPEDMEGEAPYTLTQGNAKYVLTQDLTVRTLAINIKTSNVELDLNGHTIIYDDGTPDITGDARYEEKATFGIRSGLWNFVNFKIFNGIIKQGRNGGASILGDGFNPLYLYHMGDTYNEVAGITVDYYGDDICGMKTSDGNIHHNVLYDRGSVVTDRHSGIRAVMTGSKPSNIFAFNSLRRFRHRGIDGSGKIEHNELYSDSFETNSFALGIYAESQATHNKIFGMGYNPLGVGWANDIHVSNNFIYMRGFSPSMRSTEYNRKSSVVGMRVTNYDGRTMENMLFEDNIIVLKAEDGCTGACGIWTVNSDHDNNIVYRRNKIKVEAMPGNNTNPEQGNTGAYYNGDVNYSLAAIDVCGGSTNGSEERPSPIIFEDNHCIGNVNLVIIGKSYGIGNSVWLYRTKLEKIEHDSEFFRPVRLGFWFWNTFNNRMVDTEYTGFSESEMTPYFYGSSGKMEMSYGETKTLTINDGSGAPLANKPITLRTDDDDYIQTVTTDATGKIKFDLLTVRHFKYGSSIEGGPSGVPTQIDYQRYIFSAAGYQPYSISIAELKNKTVISL
ncbi:MAG: carboxypeptidase-like regulatory domain-containing protein [Prevotellaceae bacterium]|jgi:hypothetical protein|nr:carboxypeptidase-like regulatory domain-containing protein [Prevotellaceae bacterium]